MHTKKIDDLTANQLPGLLEGSATARELLQMDLSHLDPLEAAELRDTAQQYLDHVGKLLGLLDIRDEHLSAIDAVDRALQSNWEHFKSYSLPQKARFIRIFLGKWLPLKLTGRLHKG